MAQDVYTAGDVAWGLSGRRYGYGGSNETTVREIDTGPVVRESAYDTANRLRELEAQLADADARGRRAAELAAYHTAHPEGVYAEPVSAPQRQQARYEEGQRFNAGIDRMHDAILSGVNHAPNRDTPQTLATRRQWDAEAAAGRAGTQARQEQRHGPATVLTPEQIDRALNGH